MAKEGCYCDQCVSERARAASYPLPYTRYGSLLDTSRRPIGGWDPQDIARLGPPPWMELP